MPESEPEHESGEAEPKDGKEEEETAPVKPKKSISPLEEEEALEEEEDPEDDEEGPEELTEATPPPRGRKRLPPIKEKETGQSQIKVSEIKNIDSRLKSLVAIQTDHFIPIRS
ncbi:hypothetical protein BN14_12349 [Rhizoctonia solani AG-1 IB]|uniref:Uncharacterized protein n=1 Tax=Thanatephorus cucumeris (strain AG1-IB / isolate 7/3/14) TaxID=1108050 RepID=M5CFL9_THACB|nr:hypothetical protein BN14_12349 [Rhizoctonia solani AG-1 IB]